MKALIIIAAFIALALILKIVDLASSSKIRSVGAKSNKESRNIPKIDITNEEELKKALEYYKGMAD